MQPIRLYVVVLLALILSACGSAPVRTVEQRSPPVTQTQPQAATAAQSPAPSQPTGPITSLPLSQRGGYLLGDGPGADIPPNLDAIPNAVPREEPLHRFANRPYSALGNVYTPLVVAGQYKERGIASWYGKKFHGQRTSSGEIYDMYGMTAAHPTLPIPSYARVTNVASNKSVIVRINDRGPFLHGRIMDLSYAAAYKLGYVGNGSTEVEVQSLQPAGSGAPGIPPAETVSEALPPVELPAPVTTAAATAGQIYLQLGAFKSQQGAESFLAKMRDEFEGSGPSVALYQKDDLIRVHLGPYLSQNEARLVADKLQTRLGFKPLLSQH
ncbi:MAG: septal ring lytic transglycosylase RlpA family protein [Pseudomonadota bacterium]